MYRNRPFSVYSMFFLNGGHEKYYWDHSVKCTPKYISQEDEETVRGPGHNAATQQKAATRALRSLRLAIGGVESRIWVFDGTYNQTCTLIRAFTLRGRWLFLAAGSPGPSNSTEPTSPDSVSTRPNPACRAQLTYRQIGHVPWAPRLGGPRAFKWCLKKCDEY